MIIRILPPHKKAQTWQKAAYSYDNGKEVLTTKNKHCHLLSLSLLHLPSKHCLALLCRDRLIAVSISVGICIAGESIAPVVVVVHRNDSHWFVNMVHQEISSPLELDLSDISHSSDFEVPKKKQKRRVRRAMKQNAMKTEQHSSDTITIHDEVRDFFSLFQDNGFILAHTLYL